MTLIVSFYAGLKSFVCVSETISRKKSIVSLQAMRIVGSFGICHDRKLSPFLPELKKLLDSVHVSYSRWIGLYIRQF